MASLHRKIQNIIPSARHPPPPTKTLNSHDALQLVGDHLPWLDFPPSQWDSTRRAALDSLSAWYKQHHWLASIGSVPSAYDMAVLFIILDDIFFASALPAHTNFRWMRIPQPGWLLAKGYCVTFPGRGASIRLDFMLCELYLGVLNGHIGTLLHEMCHAFVDLYRCWGRESGCMRWACQEGSTRYLADVGERGHGMAWLVLASAVEDLAKDIGVGRGVHWEASMGIEVKAKRQQRQGARGVL